MLHQEKMEGNEDKERKIEGKKKRQREDKTFVTFLFIQPKHSLLSLATNKTDVKTKRNATNIKVWNVITYFLFLLISLSCLMESSCRFRVNCKKKKSKGSDVKETTPATRFQ